MQKKKDRDKERFLSPNTKFLISMMFPRMMMCCCWCVGVDDETRATTRKKAAEKKKPFSSCSSVSSLSVPKERDERKTNEKEIQRYLKMRLLSRSLPFSSRCGCFSLSSCGTKKTTKSFENAYLGDGAVLELAGNSRELRELGGLL